MELFANLGKAAQLPKGMSEEEIAALEADDSELGSLSDGEETQMLADTARSILGLGSGSKREKAEVGGQEDGEEQE
jgi:hypothetical protein